MPRPKTRKSKRRARTRRARTWKKQHAGARSPLHEAIVKGDANKVRQLVEEGADVNEIVPDESAYPLLLIAILYRHVECVRILAKAPTILINAKNKRGSTALITASKGFGYDLDRDSMISLNIVNILLEHPELNVNEKDIDGMTALMWACRSIQPNSHLVVKRLLERDDIDVNVQNNSGKTALIIACASYSSPLETLRLLLEKEDIDIFAVDNEGNTALKYAERYPQKKAMIQQILATRPQHSEIARTPLSLPRNSENAISYMPIEDGEPLVNFHGESQLGRYYKQESFNTLPEPRLNPFTRNPIRRKNIKYHTAKLEGGKRRSKKTLRR